MDRDTAYAFLKKKESEKNLDRIRGSMIGGAAGDALGYKIEFSQESEIFRNYGKSGITDYVLEDGKAKISDDTQMTLFTAVGILVGETRASTCGIGGHPRGYVADAYQDWLKTQESDFRTVNKFERLTKEGGRSWLLDVPELFSRRAPGTTCLSALGASANGTFGTIEKPINKSKGCGGIMRIAPLALKYRIGENFLDEIEKLDIVAAELSAITHGHPLGYMPSAVVSHIISRILSTDGKMDLKEIVLEARDAVAGIFEGTKHLQELVDIINLAVELAEDESVDDLEGIHRLGEGWVAEETLAIAIFCSLRYQNDFSKAIITAVNHKGDSDSTGAVTGNIVGALVGYEAIEQKWKTNLEIADVILEVADDLCHGCQLYSYTTYWDPAWESKYIKMKRYK